MTDCRTTRHVAALAGLLALVIRVNELAEITARRAMIANIWTALDECTPEYWEESARNHLEKRIDPDCFTTEMGHSIAERRYSELTELAEVCMMKADILRRYGHPDMDAILELLDDVFDEMGAPQEVAA